MGAYAESSSGYVMDPEVRRELLAVYATVDAAVNQAAFRCDISGRCCRFTEYGHTLFLSSFEAELLLETAPPYQQPVSRDACPFQVEGRCTARAERPLACRIYFCDPDSQTWQSDLTEAAIRQLKNIADRHKLPWRYAPLHVFLNEAARPLPQAEKGNQRIPLPVSFP